MVGTGKRWKVRVLNDNWVDSYAMTLPGKMRTKMLSNLYSNIGGYIQYMAVSVGATYDLAKFFSNDPIQHKNGNSASTAPCLTPRYIIRRTPEALFYDSSANIMTDI